ncbi:MAG: hypothetical protein NTY90_04185 [Candidatus Micrarchaeota archaeon]|nr:hypothetical protein [Candidatus Micrarchaeota archaeon]
MAQKKREHSKLEKTIQQIISILDEREKRQDKVLALSREIIRDSAKAIKSIHVNDADETARIVADLDGKIVEMKKMQEGFTHISQNCYQEYAEIKSLYAIISHKEMPTYEELGIEFLPYLTGLADTVGELRRQIQLALRNKNKKDAEYFFDKMNEIYDNLMIIKYSSSLVGSLKHKQDVIRGQLEQSRSEMLR